jgi:DNA-binding CsgD family transcriptional regulator
MNTIIQAIFLAKNTHQINALLTDALEVYGIKSFAFTFYTQFPTSKGVIQYSYASPPLRSWHEYYLANSYEDSDRTLQQTKNTLEPIRWSVDSQAKRAKSTRESTLRKESKKQGIDKGISFPIHGPADDFASLVIHQREGETCFNGLSPVLHEIHILGYYCYTQLKKILRRQKHPLEKLKLTPREYQILSLTKENLQAEEVATLLHISPRTVHFHVQNALKKLGLKSKYQAVALLGGSITSKS